MNTYEIRKQLIKRAPDLTWSVHKQNSGYLKIKAIKGDLVASCLMLEYENINPDLFDGYASNFREVLYA